MSDVIPLRPGPSAQARTSALSDEGLARACGAGDPAAIGELFDRFQPRVTRYLRRLLPDDAVEDALQAVFLEVARGTAVFDGRAAVSTWLFASATNVARHERRSFARRRRHGRSHLGAATASSQGNRPKTANTCGVSSRDRGARLPADSRSVVEPRCVPLV